MQKVLPYLCILIFVLLFAAAPVLVKANEPQSAFLHVSIVQKLLQLKIQSLAEEQSALSLRTMRKASPTRQPTPTSKPKQGKQLTPTVVPTKQQTNTPQPIASATSNPSSDVASFILQGINAYRTSRGLGAVQMNGEVCAFAATRAQEIVGNFNHDGFTSRTSGKTLPYSSWSSVTENIAMTSNYQDVVNMWINSPGHAANMRKDTPFVCVQQSGNYFAYEGMKP